MAKFIYLALFLPSVLGLIEQRTLTRTLQTRLHGQNPCWQDIYDDDCSMDTVYQASFVASEWLKRLPCAAGLAVRTLLK